MFLNPEMAIQTPGAYSIIVLSTRPTIRVRFVPPTFLGRFFQY